MNVWTGFGRQPLERMVRHYWLMRHSDLPFYRRQMAGIARQYRETRYAN